MTTTDAGSTEHSRKIRAALRAAREQAELTQQQVADRVTERLQLERPLTGSAVSEWERFNRHPSIDVMAAWARVLGLRLVVDLDSASGERIPVLLRPESADLARAIDLLSEDDRQLIKGMLGRMRPRRP